MAAQADSEGVRRVTSGPVIIAQTIGVVIAAWLMTALVAWMLSKIIK